MVMEEDLSHLDTDCRPHARMGVDDRLLWIKQDRWINYVRAEKVLDRLADLLSYPPRARIPSLLLFADPAMGKTHILEKFLRDHRSVSEFGTRAVEPLIIALRDPEAGVGIVHPPSMGYSDLQQQST